MNFDFINIATEDELSETIFKKIIETANRRLKVGIAYRRGGSGYLRRSIKGFNNAAKVTPFFILTDLDQCTCVPQLINEWFDFPKHDNLIFRVAVKEVESWVLADDSGLAKLFQLPVSQIPRNPDLIQDPKDEIVKLARKSKVNIIKNGVPPRIGTTAKVGPLYNDVLCEFVRDHWNFRNAFRYSKSLKKAIERVSAFRPL